MPDILFVILYCNRYSLYLASLQLNSISNVLQFILFHLTCLFETLSMNIQMAITCLAVLFALLSTFVAFIKFTQTNDFIRDHLRLGRLTESHFNCFLRENHRSLLFLTDATRIYGNLLFGFFLLNTPLNATILMMLLLGSTSQMTGSIRLFLGFVFIAQIFIMALFSIYPTILSLKLHAPSRRLLALPAKHRNQWSLKGRLKLSFYLEQFHTLNRYTVDLGKFGGKITYASTGRHVFFYLKLLIFAYKLVLKLNLNK